MKKTKKLSAIACLFFIVNLTVITHGGMYNGNETIGYVQEFDGGQLHIIGEAITGGGYDDVLINISNAPIYDLITGYQVGPHTIHEGISIRAAYIASNAEPFDALAIWLNWDNKDAAVFSATVSENIQHIDGACVFLSFDGKYRVTLSQDTVIICPQRGQLTPMDIRPGHEFFVWVDMFTASSPAKVFPDKVVLLN